MRYIGGDVTNWKILGTQTADKDLKKSQNNIKYIYINLYTNVLTQNKLQEQKLIFKINLNKFLICH